MWDIPIQQYFQKTLNALKQFTKTQTPVSSLGRIRSLISTFVVRCLDSMICILAISKDWGFQLASVAEQAGLNLTCSKSPKTHFREMWLTWRRVFLQVCYNHNESSLNEPRHDKTNKMSVRPAKTQISLGIRPVWSDSSLCAQWVAKDPSFLHADSEDSDQTDRMPRLIRLRWAHSHFVGLVMSRLKLHVLERTQAHSFQQSSQYLLPTRHSPFMSALFSFEGS